MTSRGFLLHSFSNDKFYPQDRTPPPASSRTTRRRRRRKGDDGGGQRELGGNLNIMM